MEPIEIKIPPCNIELTHPHAKHIYGGFLTMMMALASLNAKKFADPNIINPTLDSSTIIKSSMNCKGEEGWEVERDLTKLVLRNLADDDRITVMEFNTYKLLQIKDPGSNEKQHMTCREIFDAFKSFYTHHSKRLFTSAKGHTSRPAGYLWQAMNQVFRSIDKIAVGEVGPGIMTHFNYNRPDVFEFDLFLRDEEENKDLDHTQYWFHVVLFSPDYINHLRNNPLPL